MKRVRVLVFAALTMLFFSCEKESMDDGINPISIGVDFNEEVKLSIEIEDPNPLPWGWGRGKAVWEAPMGSDDCYFSGGGCGVIYYGGPDTDFTDAAAFFDQNEMVRVVALERIPQVDGVEEMKSLLSKIFGEIPERLNVEEFTKNVNNNYSFVEDTPFSENLIKNSLKNMN